MKNKVIVLLCCIFFVAIFTSCEQVLKENAGRLLPNGYLSSKSEEEELFKFALEKGYIAQTSRSFDDYSTGKSAATVDEMITELKKVFGDVAENYYWEEDITDQCTFYLNGNKLASQLHNSRSESFTEMIRFELEDEYGNYEARLHQRLKRYSGLWWVYYKFLSEPLIRENSTLIYNDYVTFQVNKININYKDDENDLYYERAFPNFYYDYTSLNELLVLLDDGMSSERRVELKGKSKNGWLPKMNSIITTVQYVHPAIRGGDVTITSYYREK